MSERVTFDQAVLSQALALVSKVQPWRLDGHSRGVVQILVADDVAKVSSVADSLQIVVTIPCHGGCAALYPALGILQAMCAKTQVGAQISLTTVEQGTLFQAGRSRSVIAGAAKEAMPVRPAPDGPRRTMPAAALLSGLSAALPAAIDDRARPYLGGVMLRDSAAGATFAAQDGNRIHAAAQDGNRIHAAALIPQAAARAAVATMPDAGTAEIVVGERAIMFVSGDVELTSSLLLNAFPSIEQQMTSPTTRELLGNAAGLLADLDLVMTVADSRDRDFRLDLGAACEASAFRVLGSSPDSGAVRLDARFAGEPLAIGFQFPLVRDALNLFGEHEIAWGFGGAENASLITSPTLPGVEAMVSPFRLAADHQRLAA